MRSGLVQFFEDAYDFGELVHEGLACMESSSGIYEDGIQVLGLCFVQALVSYGGGILSVLSLDDGEVQAVCPDGELFLGTCPECIGSHQEWTTIWISGLQQVGESCYARGFARAIDADEQVNGGLVAFNQCCGVLGGLGILKDGE